LAIRTNLSIAAHDCISSLGVFISGGKEEKLVEEYRKLLNIRMASPDQIVGNLSGGNQQKVVLARWLALRPRVLIVDEPTRGIDVGAKVEVHNLLIEMARSGIAIIVISSELPEVLALADRIVTMREGRVAGTGYELTVIASVVIGGTSLFGGSGSIFGTVIGTLLIGVLLNGLVLMNVNSYIQQIIIGVIIVLAVAFDTFAKSRRKRA